MSATVRRQAPPDNHANTFLAHALSLYALHGARPWPDGGYPLPDAPPDEETPFLNGSSLDGISTHHASVKPDVSTANAAADLIRELAAVPQPASGLWPLHDLLAERSALQVADQLSMVLAGGPPREAIHAIGRWLAEHGTRRNAVAIGVVLVGLGGTSADRELLLLLGGIEDLTLYAAVALRRSQPDPDQALFELAQRVNAWGRVHAVERLTGTTDPVIRDWLLREGFRNRVMNEYLAHVAATTGDLLGALSMSIVDDELLDSASDLIDALCTGGPAKDITDYPDGPAVIERYLALASARSPRLRRLIAVMRISLFLDTDKAKSLRWTGPARTRLRRQCQALIARDHWRGCVAAALDDPDVARFRQALWPAERLGISVGDRVRERLGGHPLQVKAGTSSVQDWRIESW